MRVTTFGSDVAYRGSWELVGIGVNGNYGRELWQDEGHGVLSSLGTAGFTGNHRSPNPVRLE